MGASQWRVVVRVYANFAGLSRKLVRVGINGSVGDLVVFASGFTRSQPLFDFVDAGYGKEGADYKIRGTPSLQKFSSVLIFWSCRALQLVYR